MGELFASFDLDSSGMSGTIKTIESSMEKLGSSMTKIGGAMSLAVTTPLTALAKDVVQTSIDFESAFAGVRKTIDATETEYEALADTIKGMTLEIPQTAESLASIMEMGGQLGIAKDALGEFTETIAAMGVATNLTTEDASSMFAQFANIMGMSQSDFDRLGSTVVALGNSFATTEADVMRMAMRMASVGTNLKMSESDVLAFATAMSSVGILAEVGGSSFSTFASNLQLAVATNSKSLKTYASVAGMTTKEFKKAFEEDATGAITAFITGLGKVESTGKTAIEVLDSLGISEVGQRNMLLALASSGDLLNQTLELSADAWEQNIALLKEASTRYGTTESQIQIMKNAMDLIKLDIGDMALPHLKTLTTLVVSATEAFLGMSTKSKLLGVKMAALAAATGPVLVGAGQMLSMLTKLGPALLTLVSPLGLVASGLGLFAVAAIDADNTIGKTFSKMARSATRYLDKIDTEVKSAIQGISDRMPALANSLSDGISIALPEITSSALGIVAAMGDMIAENSDELLDLGLTIVESIVSGVSQSLPKIVASGANLVSGLIDAFTSGRISESVKTMFDSIKTGIDATDWSAAGTQIVNSVTGALTSLKTSVTTKIDEAKTAMKEMTWSDVAESIKSGISIPSDWLKGVILGDTLTEDSTWKDVGTKVWGWIKNGFSAAEGWLKSLVLGEDGSDAGWADVGDKIVEKISTSLSAITPEKMAEGIGDLSAIAGTIIDKIINSKADFAVAASSLITKLVSGIGGFTEWESVSTDLNTFAKGVIDSTVNAISKTTGAAASIAGAIGGLFAGVSLEDVAGIFSGLAGLVIDGLVSGIQAGASGATKITGALTEALSSVNAAGTGTIIGDFGADLLDKILESITDTTAVPDMTKLMENIGKGMAEGVVFMGDVTGAIVGYILSPEGLTTIGAAGRSIAGALVQGIGLGLYELSEGIFNALSGIFNAALSSVMSWFGIETDTYWQKIGESMFTSISGSMLSGAELETQYLKEQMGTILDQANAYLALKAFDTGNVLAQYSTHFSEAGIALVQALQSGMLSESEQVTAMAGLIVAGMDDGLQAMYPELYSQGYRAVEQFEEGFGNGTESLIAVCQALGIQVPTTLAEALGGDGVWTPAVDATKAGMQQALDATAELAKSGGEMVATSTTEGITMGYQNATQSVQTAVDTMTNIVTGAQDLTTIAADAQTTGQTAGQNIGSGVSGEQTNVETSVQGVVDGMSTTFGPIATDFNNTTFSAMSNVVSTVNAMRPSVTIATTSAMTSAVNAAKGVMNSTAGYNIGKDVMQGMINAIRAMSGTLASAARSAVNNAIAAMRKAADAHSPSRKTLALGEDMDEGGAIGLSGGLMAAAAAQAVKDSVKAMADEAYIADPGAGTVMTARQSARQVASETARSMSNSGDTSFAREVGAAMADRLIESGALEGDVYVGDEKVGKKLTKPVSKNIAKKSKYTIKGRSAKEVVLA